MPNYRRVFVPGGTYFFTVNLLDRKSRLLIDHIDSLRTAVCETQQRFPFEIDAMVILPDHIHAVWTLPTGDSDFSVRWRWIKIRFSRSIPKVEQLSTVRQARGERGIWQRRYWEHLIRDDRDLQRHIDYCWFNPIKHGYVEAVADWPFSSFHRDHQDRLRPSDIARSLDEHTIATRDLRFGERE